MKSAHLKSLDKVYAFLECHKRATPTQLTRELNLSYSTVRACINTLRKLGKLRIMSNDKVTIMELKEGNNE